MNNYALFQEQRHYTAQAGELAGLKIKKIISEPTAAAMAYGLHKRDGEHNIIIQPFLLFSRSRRLTEDGVF